jgi:hypothetical protein
MSMFWLIWDTLYMLAFGGFIVGTACILFFLVFKAYNDWLHPDDTDL